MPEIKSAIELAMERTKHLSLSREERQAQQAEQFKARLKGIIYKFCAEMISAPEAENQLLELKNRLSNVAEQAQTALKTVLPLDEKGLEFSSLFKKVFDLDSKQVSQVIQDYKKALANKKQAITTSYLASLLENMGISGTALEVNLDSLSDWQTAQTALEKEFRSRLFTDN